MDAQKQHNPLQSDIKYLKGVGEFRSRLLGKLGIKTLGDLMEFFPRDYIVRNRSSRVADLIPGKQNSFVGRVTSVEKRRLNANRSQLNVTLTDGTDALYCTWFHFGAWIQEQLHAGCLVWVSGSVTTYRGSFQIVHPELEILDKNSDDTPSFWHNRQVLPVYPLTEKISMNLMRTLVYRAFSLYAEAVEETLPSYLLEKFGFPSRYKGLQIMHFGQDISLIESTRKRFAFEELFYNQLMLARCMRHHHRGSEGINFELKRTYTTVLKQQLPFTLTSAQKKVIREIVGDMTSPSQMNRLLQGDVGSGKTIVTVFAMLLAIENGYQAVLMAPTEILADQHMRSISALLEGQPEINIGLLKGGSYRGKRQMIKDIAAGDVNIIIGTHALIQKDVIFHDLGFVAIDEQHRFGVEQRALLTRSGRHPDVLYLSATPIPRSLALTVYGDLDMSILDELPPGRRPVETIWRNSNKNNLTYGEVRRELKRGRQVYIVCPLIEESEKMDLVDATSVYEHVSVQEFPEFSCALLHGRMKQEEKDVIMRRFKEGEISVLVSTTVIEVGIDVPNASVMLIEHAERFGLSQLHQLRGRVGRGSAQSFCYLIAHPPLSSEARVRLHTMVSTNDGFVIAEKDLELRGPGEFFGTEQSGIPGFKHANIIRDQELLRIARSIAMDIVSQDADFTEDRHAAIGKTYFTNFIKGEKLFMA